MNKQRRINYFAAAIATIITIYGTTKLRIYPHGYELETYPDKLPYYAPAVLASYGIPFNYLWKAVSKKSS